LVDLDAYYHEATEVQISGVALTTFISRLCANAGSHPLIEALRDQDRPLKIQLVMARPDSAFVEARNSIERASSDVTPCSRNICQNIRTLKTFCEGRKDEIAARNALELYVVDTFLDSALTYIKRSPDGINNETEDAILFWGPIACYTEGAVDHAPQFLIVPSYHEGPAAALTTHCVNSFRVLFQSVHSRQIMTWTHGRVHVEDVAISWIKQWP
jgi:hypothetical protein